MSFQEYSESMLSRLHLGDVNRNVLIGAVAIALVAVIAVVLVIAPQLSAAADTPFSIEKTDEGDEGMQIEEHGVNEGDGEASGSKGEDQLPATLSSSGSQICVHVAGYVKNPGVVYLAQGSRIADAVESAGGFRKGASSDSINLAEMLSDGQQIVIPSKKDVSGKSSNLASNGISQSMEPSDAGSKEGRVAASGGKVNLNAASVSELQALSGIGPSKAQKIVEYREQNGGFKSVEDLLNVSGIGEKTLESIRQEVCV